MGQFERMLGCREISVALLLQERAGLRNRTIESPQRTRLRGVGEVEAKGSQLGSPKRGRRLTNLATRPPVRRARRKWRIHGMFHLLISLLLPLPPSHHHRIHLFTVHRALS